MTNTTVTLPPVSPQFQEAVRILGQEIGWRNVARMIAYGPVRVRERLTAEEREARKLEAALRKQEIEEARLYLACDNPVLSYCNYRKVMRPRVPRHNYGALPERVRMTQVEQVTVGERLALQLKERGIRVEHSRKGAWWADVEDEVWGADCWMSECFDGRYGTKGYTFDDALTLLRKADQVRRELGPAYYRKENRA